MDETVARWLRAGTLDAAETESRILSAEAPSVRARQWGRLRGFGACGAAGLQAALAEAGPIALSLSHDHYVTVGGGLQNCVAAEAEALTAAGWSYLHLCPDQPLPTLAPAGAPAEFGAVATLGGRTLGRVSLADVATVLHGRPVAALLLHQLLGFAPEGVAALHAALGAPAAFFAVHDLFAHCPSVHLLRNEATFCGGPPPASAACAICHAGPERPAHLRRMAALFEALRPTVLAPSQTILDEWRRIGAFPHRDARVVPPARLVRDGERPAGAGPLRIGFLGTAAFHKGWPAFAALVLGFGDDGRFAFHQLGWQAEALPGLQNRVVHVTPAEPDAMVRAVRALELDVVLNWSRCFESFSFTALEALAGGALVLARRGAGNVLPLVRAHDPARAVAADTVTELEAMLHTGSLAAVARAAPRWTGRIERRSGAAELLLA